jgi:hypothetical protein
MLKPAVTISVSIILIILGLYGIHNFKGLSTASAVMALYFGIAHIGSFFEKDQTD